MADKKQTNAEFFSEILSPSQLFAARSRSHKIPIKGQKDFFPNDSDEQRRRLEQSLDEHWGLISEERVERRGNLVEAKWIPGKQIVELQSPAGKFWQTMGFSANGKQLLLPEEALYLMDLEKDGAGPLPWSLLHSLSSFPYGKRDGLQGNLQVVDKDLPLSIQDGYEKFLSTSTVSLQQYQVFGHLKRLGYVVHRFNPSSEPTAYARQLNLPHIHDQAGGTLKRKRSPSPTPTAPSLSVEQEQSIDDRMVMEKSIHEDEEKEKNLSESHLTPSSGTHTATATSSNEGGAKTWWMTDVLVDQSDNQLVSRCTHWNFNSIPFPDLGFKKRKSLRPPEPSLLPGALVVGVCDVASWSRRLNLRKVKMSPKEKKRDKYRHRQDINKDREVRRCKNWAEYRNLLARRHGKHRPVEHLWKREVTPLHNPTQPIPHEELLDKIGIIKSTDLLEGASSIKASGDWRICFNVYQPESASDFKKSNPGKPYTRMCVCSFEGPVPDLRAIKLLAFQSGDVPVVFAVVDQGDISFFTFKDFQLPKDVFP